MQAQTLKVSAQHQRSCLPRKASIEVYHDPSEESLTVREWSSCRDKPRTEQTPIWHPASKVPYHLIGVRAVAGQGDQESEEDSSNT